MFKYSAATFLCLCFSFSSAALWTVNLDGSGDFSDIQSAINAAEPNDIVQVADGIYFGEGNRNISFLGKAITVKSINGPNDCIIDGQFDESGLYRGFIFDFEETRNSILEGVTVTDFYYITCCPGGAGIYVDNASPVIRNCIVLNCHTELDTCPCVSYGGGIFVGENSQPLFSRCKIIGNSHYSGSGGGIACMSYSQDSFLTIENCMIIDNNSSVAGGGVFSYSRDQIQIANCTIAYNSASAGGGAYFESLNAPPPMTVKYSILWENWPDDSNYGLIGGNYITKNGPATRPDPKFVDPAKDDYHLQWDSPCINFCTNPGYDPTDVDFDGEPRQMGAAVDAGADEVGPKQADFSRNGSIDLIDFEIFSRSWGMTHSDPGWNILCDLEKDDVIDTNDLQILSSDWLWQADWYQ